MMLHDQLLLMAAVIGLYLGDSMLLLCHNEIVLQSHRGGFIVSAGAAAELGGRHLFLPNPCCPQRMLVRLSWPDAGAPERCGSRMQRTTLALKVIAPWTWLLLGLFMLGLPCALRFGMDGVLLAWLALTYLTIVAMLLQVFRYRKALNLSRRAVLALAFDALLCAPFAINMIRKISLRQASPASLYTVASSMLSTGEKQALTRILSARIQLDLAFVDAGSAASDALHAYLKQFEDITP